MSLARSLSADRGQLGKQIFPQRRRISPEYLPFTIPEGDQTNESEAKDCSSSRFGDQRNIKLKQVTGHLLVAAELGVRKRSVGGLRVVKRSMVIAPALEHAYI